jgi:uridylate kinase
VLVTTIPSALAAALRGMEVNADVIIKGTQVDGVYTDDPKKNPDARRFDRLTYSEALEYRVRVMDLTAITLCMDHHIPLIVLNVWDDHSLIDAVLGKTVGTLIDGA